MFVLRRRHVNRRQLKLLRLQFVPPLLLTGYFLLLLAVSTCHTVTAAAAAVNVAHKSQLSADSSRTPNTAQSVSRAPLHSLRLRRHAFDASRDGGQLEYWGRNSDAAGLRKYLNSDCVQYEHQPG